MRAVCHNCRMGEFPGPSPTGWCRVSPPKVVIVDGDFASCFPKVAHDDWCGEHQPAKPGATASVALMAEAIAPFLDVANEMARQSAEMIVSTDLKDGEDNALYLSTSDFLRLADAYARAIGA